MSLRGRASLLLAVWVTASTCAAAGSQVEKIVWSPLRTALGLYLSDPDGTHQRSFMSDLQPNYNASFSYDGRWVVFTSERFGTADVFRVHPDGSGLERLTDSPSFDDQGTLSPDGQTLAFVSTREGGTANIWLSDIETRRSRNLTRSKAGNFRPSWSPDGKWIAFSSDRDMPRLRLIREWGQAWELTQRTAVYIVHPDGSGLRRLTALEGSAGTPRWSPDSRRVVFAQVMDVEAMRRAHITTQIVSVDVYSSATETLSDGTNFAWSPAYVTQTDIGYGLGNPLLPGAGLIYTSGRKGPANALSPSWSPEGSLLVFDREVPAQTTGPHVIRSRDPRFELIGDSGFNDIVSFAGTGEEFVYRPSPFSPILKLMRRNEPDRIIFDGGATQRRIGDAVAVSADGRRIAFAIADSPQPDEVGQIVVMDSDGSHFRIATHDVGHDEDPSFSPDGTRLVYRVGASRERLHTQRGLRILSLADGTTTQLTNGWDDFPAWSPRGDRIAFTGFETGDYEIYTIRPDGTGLRQLTRTHGDDAHEVWSPDGKWIAFVSSRMGWKDEAMISFGSQPYGEIFVMRADGTAVKQLTDDQWEKSVAGWPPSSLDAASVDAALHGSVKSH